MSSGSITVLPLISSKTAAWFTACNS
uniref:Uncharacterized protein n=1 Tax=Arundo donax TaxID=35708 RepID=A0A0A8ZLV2_ARUDO